MPTIKVAQTQLLKWRNMLYNVEQLMPRIYFVVEEFPKRPISLSKSPLPLFARNSEIYFERTRSGWRCSHQLEVILNAPCPLLTRMMQEDIRLGYKTIDQCQNAVTITRRDVLVAAFNRLNRN